MACIIKIVGWRYSVDPFLGREFEPAVEATRSVGNMVRDLIVLIKGRLNYNKRLKSESTVGIAGVDKDKIQDCLTGYAGLEVPGQKLVTI